MTIAAPSLDAVRAALRVDALPEDDPDRDADNAMLTRHVEAATALANRQAPTAPEAVGHEAIIRMVGWLYEGPSHTAGTDQVGAWRRSGAESLLAPWTVRRAGAIQASE